ncbi:MAG TPA: VTT domain-containing protein [Vicinamibacterales bacterium]|nr:VTT domain-containing protein [Vicinamibacterales bacterium]
MLHLLVTHGLAVVGAASLLESLGAPVPAFPLLLLAGSLAAENRFSAVPLVLASASGFWIGDLAWYAFGRFQGRRVLGLLCRLSLNPDACVGRAERRFRRRPAITVAAAKFIPGFGLMVAPLAGILRMPPGQFAAIDGAAAIAWSAAAVMSGVLYGRRVLPHVMRTQQAIGVLGGAAVLAFVGWKLYERRWLVRHYSVARVEISELQRLLASEPGDLLVIDLRSEQAFSGSTQMVLGARRIPPGDFERHIDTMPRDKEIILYCT